MISDIFLIKVLDHWAWFIPIDDEVVSVGIVVPSAYFLSKQESKLAFLVRELHELHPELKRRLPEIKLVEEVHHYRDLLTDVLAGRIYEHENQPSVAVNDFRRLLGRAEERERSYCSADLYSVPIGSRYHPERAPLWEASSAVKSTENG